MKKKSIVVYYSASGNTKAVAEKIQQAAGGDIQEIVPITPYVKSYNELLNEAKREIQKRVKRPIRSINLSSYDVIYIGSPVWWGTVAPPLMTLIDENNLAGKTIVPFVTHGGGGKGHSDRDLEKACPDSTVTEMLEIYGRGNRNSEKEIEEWLKGINLD